MSTESINEIKRESRRLLAAIRGIDAAHGSDELIEQIILSAMLDIRLAALDEMKKLLGRTLQCRVNL